MITRMDNDIFIGLRVPSDIISLVDKEAERSDRSRSYVIRNILINHYSPKVPE